MSSQDDKDIALLKRNFIAFLFVMWKALNLPQPTRCQIDMGKELANGKQRRFILQAFRGIGKSFITCAFVVWTLWNNPDMKIMIVSASKERADANSVFIKNIIGLLPFLHHLKANPNQRDSTLSFDVGPAKPDHSPSVKSVGITGQLTGSRADIIIADDVEVPGNSMTQTAREHLGELVKEFDAILKPDVKGRREDQQPRIIYLGTPQTEMTLYRELEKRGYSTIIWPARYPYDAKNLASYFDEVNQRQRLAPTFLKDLDGNPMLMGTSTELERFSEEDLRKRELSYGKGGFALQFMLNPNLSDAERYPLKLRDLIVGAFSMEQAPLTYQWLPNPSCEAHGLPMVGLTGDRYYRYHSAVSDTSPYLQKILAIDPSGRGKDETGYAVVYQLNGYLYLMEAGGFRGGYEDATLEKLALLAKKHKVNAVVLESNFGDGMYTKLLSPVLMKHHKCAIEEVRANKMKEMRICDVLEPLMGSHKLIVHEDVITRDYETARNADGNVDQNYSLFYQMTRISRDKGALAHDDRLDALALACQFFQDHLEKDSEIGRQEMVEEFLEEHLEAAFKFQTARQVQAHGVTSSWEDDDDSLGSIFHF